VEIDTSNLVDRFIIASQSKPMDDISTTKGASLGHMILFNFRDSNHNSGTAEGSVLYIYILVNN